MEKEIKLTIAVPTYNRCKLLKVALDSIIAQWRDDIEVYVSDNASSDGTEEMMKEYCAKYPIQYVRNSENLGADRNFLNCFRMGKGKYVHLLSDDDLLLPGAVERIIRYIEKEPDYINLNSYTYFTDVFDPEDRKPPRIKLEKDLITLDKKEYMRHIGCYITYVSAIVSKNMGFLTRNHQGPLDPPLTRTQSQADSQPLAVTAGPTCAPRRWTAQAVNSTSVLC